MMGFKVTGIDGRNKQGKRGGDTLPKEFKEREVPKLKRNDEAS